MSTEWVRSYYDAVDAMSMEDYLGWHTDDVRVQFANNPTAEGAAQVGQAIGHFWSLIDGLSHELINVWEVGDDWTVVEEHVTYRRKDGRTVVCPGVTTLHKPGRRVDEVRVFIDLAPVFAPAELEGAASA